MKQITNQGLMNHILTCVCPMASSSLARLADVPLSKLIPCSTPLVNAKACNSALVSSSSLFRSFSSATSFANSSSLTSSLVGACLASFCSLRNSSSSDSISFSTSSVVAFSSRYLIENKRLIFLTN